MIIVRALLVGLCGATAVLVGGFGLYCMTSGRVERGVQWTTLALVTSLVGGAIARDGDSE